MTDYLEELLDNTSALLEQVRRLERSGARTAPEGAEGREVLSASRLSRRGTEKQTAAGGLEEMGDVPVLPAGHEKQPDAPAPPSRDRGGETAAAQSGPAADSGLVPPERVRTPLEEEEQNKEGSVLLEQLERLERAAESGTGAGAAVRSSAWGETGGLARNGSPGTLAGTRQGAVYPNLAGETGDGWALETDFVRPDLQTAGELRWAEQADRVFRRDSRRYDGDFYLY